MKLKDASACLLVDGHEALGTRIDIRPTMKTITHNGRTYSRMNGVFSEWPDGTIAADYLWDGWAYQRIAEAKGI